MLLLALAALQQEPALALPALFSDGLVLQQQTRAPLWGRAAPGALVELRASWDAEPLAVTADAEGRWRAELVTPAAGGPFELRIASGAQVRVLADVLVGEVWLASGQSNMEWHLADGVEGGAEAVRASEDPSLRFFTVADALAPAPQADFEGRWLAASPASAPGFSACAYFFARRLRAELGVPVGIVSAAWGGTPAEAWMRAEALAPFSEFAPELARQAGLAHQAERARAARAGPPPNEGLEPIQPTVLWNAMIAPLVPAALRGVIWYQGESNRTRALGYGPLFQALIRDWRAVFGQPEMPFYFVQIAPFAYPQDHGGAGALRDAQRRALALPNTGMAVTMDIGDRTDPHPKRKREVGERLALWALAGTYRRPIEYSGPLYCSMRVEGGAIRIEFEHGEGLTSRGEPVRHATIAGPDGVFHPAEARIEGATLVVASPAVPTPRAVRFGAGAADETNLWNAAGLPAASFRTDDWP